MNEIETRPETDEHRPLNSWLTESVRLALPRYWLLLATCAAFALVLVALD
ncbi:MAG: hypothetical protein ACTS10_02480 [Kiloniellales bacterium]